MSDKLYAVNNIYINDQFVAKGEVVKITKENKDLVSDLIDQGFVVNENPEKIVVFSWKDKIETLEAEVTAKNQKIKELEKNVSDLQEEVETLKNDIVEKQNDIIALAQAIDNKDAEITDLKKIVETKDIGKVK